MDGGLLFEDPRPKLNYHQKRGLPACVTSNWHLATKLTHCGRLNYRSIRQLSVGRVGAMARLVRPDSARARTRCASDYCRRIGVPVSSKLIIARLPASWKLSLSEKS